MELAGRKLETADLKLQQLKLIYVAWSMLLGQCWLVNVDWLMLVCWWWVHDVYRLVDDGAL